MAKINLPPAAIEAAKHSVDVVFGNKQQVGFMLDTLNGTELAYTLLRNVNKFLTENYETDINLYTLNKMPPIITPICGIFNSLELSVHRSSLVACDPVALIEMRIAQQAKHFYYAYDPLLLNFLDEKGKKYIRSLDIITIARNKGHSKLLNEFGLKVSPHFVPNLEIETLLEIVYGK